MVIHISKYSHDGCDVIYRPLSQCSILQQPATCSTVHSNPAGPPMCPNLTLSFGNRLIVLRGRSTRRTRRDLIVLMSFPLLLPLWKDVRVGRREEREWRSGWVVGGPQVHRTPPLESGVSLAQPCPFWGRGPSSLFGLGTSTQMAFCGSGVRAC